MLFMQIIAIIILSLVANASWQLQRVVKGDKIVAKSLKKTDKTVFFSGQVLRRIPKYLPEGAPPSKEIYEEVLLSENELTSYGFDREFVQQELADTWTDAEVRPIVVQGPPKNRINLTIVGDGYTLDQKERFFEDAQFITDGLFKDRAFSSYLPLFNVYAVFVPSKESGVGDGRPKNTALKLYRDPKGSKRGIMPGDEKAADRAIALAPATDYPILIANDDFYGGLGGKYAISTRSRRSGLIVLRHELGHNFGHVGEEYDGGFVYMGANASRNADASWKYWNDTGNFKTHKASKLAGEYVWKNLEGGPFDVFINFPSGSKGSGSNLNLIISSTGWATDQDVEMTLDGNRLNLPGPFHEDRNFYDLTFENFAPGSHKISCVEKIKDHDNVIAFVQAFALPSDYDTTPGVIGSFATYDAYGNMSFRPTHKSCLMRDMTVDYFCNVDRENMWHQFLGRTTLIDDVEIKNVFGENNVSLKTMPLTGLDVHWFEVSGFQEKERTDLAGKRDWSSKTGGNFKVVVKFQTPEVRKYSARFSAEKRFSF